MYNHEVMFHVKHIKLPQKGVIMKDLSMKLMYFASFNEAYFFGKSFKFINGSAFDVIDNTLFVYSSVSFSQIQESMYACHCCPLRIV